MSVASIDMIAAIVPVASTTFLDFGIEKLRSLGYASETSEQAEALVPLFRRLVGPWGNVAMGARPTYRSHIADDQAPFEFALAISAGPPEIQFYVEAQGTPPDLISNMIAGRSRLDTIAGEFGLPVDRLRRVQHLFFPENPQPPFTVWIGVSGAAGRDPKFKVYLNPQVRGPERAEDLVTNALDALGYGRAWSTVRPAISSASARRDEIAIVSLDLSEATDARVKVYTRHHNAAVADIDVFAKLALDYVPGDVAQFYAAVAPHTDRFLSRPALTELAFVDPHANRPSAVTIECPVGSYTADDAEAAERIRRCMTSFGLRTDVYDRAIHAFAARPLNAGPGIHAHVTFSRIHAAPRVGVYLASEAFNSGRKWNLP